MPRGIDSRVSEKQLPFESAYVLLRQVKRGIPKARAKSSGLLLGISQGETEDRRMAKDALPNCLDAERDSSHGR